MAQRPRGTAEGIARCRSDPSRRYASDRRRPGPRCACRCSPGGETCCSLRGRSCVDACFCCDPAHVMSWGHHGAGRLFGCCLAERYAVVMIVGQRCARCSGNSNTWHASNADPGDHPHRTLDVGNSPPPSAPNANGHSVVAQARAEPADDPGRAGRTYRIRSDLPHCAYGRRRIRPERRPSGETPVTESTTRICQVPTSSATSRGGRS